MIGIDKDIIPQDWDVKTLDDIANISSGGSAPQGEKYFNGENPFVRVQHIDQNSDSINKYDLVTDEAIKKCKLKKYKSGTIVFPKSGASIYLEKRAVLPVDAYIVSHLCAVESVTDDIDQEFLFYILKQIPLSKDKADGYPTLNLSEIKRVAIPTPPFKEQEKIVSVLSKIKKAIEQQEQIIAKTKELKRSLMHRIFTHGLRDEELKETEIGQIPKSWNVRKFEELADFKNGINFSAEQKGKKGVLTVDVLNMYSDDIMVELNNLYRVNINLSNKPDYLLEDEDILFVRSSLKREGVGWTTLFKSGLEPITFCGFIIRARIKPQYCLPMFITYFFRSEVARKKLISSERVAITNINQGMLRSFLVPIPNIEEQTSIVSLLQTVDTKISQAKCHRQSLQALFKSMLNNLMTGQIRVKDIDFGEINV